MSNTIEINVNYKLESNVQVNGPTEVQVNPLPVAGTTGQVLAKKTDADYDVEWVNQSGGGGGEVELPLTKPYNFYAIDFIYYNTTDNTNGSTASLFANGLELQGLVTSEDILLDFICFGFATASGLSAKLTIYELNSVTGLLSKILESPVLPQSSGTQWQYEIAELDRIVLKKSKAYFVGVNFNINITARTAVRGTCDVLLGGNSTKIVGVTPNARERFRVAGINHNGAHPDTIDSINIFNKVQDAVLIGYSGQVVP